MSTTEKQVAGTAFTALSTELNSLATTANTAAGTAFNNVIGGGGGDGYTRFIVELVVTFGSAPAAGTPVTVWFLYAPDGTNYEDGSASVTPQKTGVVFQVRAVTSAQRITRTVSLPPTLIKAVANNGTAQSMASSGNTVKIFPYTPQGV